ncbi:hypothetical protein L202_01475 [Cryptococcus amylolentus CBS 6039]|uniref:Uncharacterized protein n=1 Tax=Cryptococcus amylolentus CBS 6039 TaxID=1295533 RepID=A0A1E3I440_9TREE|nr:hypothetical protein L202_01475 [Cryptococcus amylolentus CBS 6039]ODN83308.1 hypothetical protein L202_01475 [Cryptococcus amylolentus CBS 6039]
MDPVLPYRLEWRADNEKRSGKPDSRLCRVPTDGGGEGFWTSDKIIEGKKEPWFRVMAALLMKALDGGDGIWLGVDDQAEVTMTGDFGVVVNELVTRKASEILIMNYSFGFVLRLSQKETLGNGDIRFHLKASPMAGHVGQVVDFRPNGRVFEPIYKHASLLTDKVLGPRRAFGLPSSPSED